MKTQYFAAIALFAQFALAVPHGNHNNLHRKHATRPDGTPGSDMSSTPNHGSGGAKTVVVTVTDYNAILWVDRAGHTLSTEHKGPLSTKGDTSKPTSTPISSDSGDDDNSSNTTGASVSTKGSTVKSTAATSTGGYGDDDDSNTSGVSVSSQPTAAPTTVDNDDDDDNTAASSVSTGLDGASTPSGTVVDRAKTQSGGSYSGFNVAYDPQVANNCNAQSIEKHYALFASKGFKTVRQYDNCFKEAITSATQHNLKLMIGISTYDNTKLQQLITAVKSSSQKWAPVSAVFFGNEQNSNDAAAQTGNARSALKTAGYTGPVVTVFEWGHLKDNPALCDDASPFCAVNIHAFFDLNTKPADSGKYVLAAQAAVQRKISKNRPVIVTESGWPHAGTYTPPGSSTQKVGSAENQKAAMDSIMASYSSKADQIYLFQAFDTNYKSTAYEKAFGLFSLP